MKDRTHHNNSIKLKNKQRTKKRHIRKRKKGIKYKKTNKKRSCNERAKRLNNKAHWLEGNDIKDLIQQKKKEKSSDNRNVIKRSL